MGCTTTLKSLVYDTCRETQLTSPLYFIALESTSCCVCMPPYCRTARLTALLCYTTSTSSTRESVKRYRHISEGLGPLDRHGTENMCAQGVKTATVCKAKTVFLTDGCSVYQNMLRGSVKASLKTVLPRVCPATHDPCIHNKLRRYDRGSAFYSTYFPVSCAALQHILKNIAAICQKRLFLPQNQQLQFSLIEHTYLKDDTA
eukprot:1174723-Pleurochrysis_carterae.AAC.1